MLEDYGDDDDDDDDEQVVEGGKGKGACKQLFDINKRVKVLFS